MTPQQFTGNMARFRSYLQTQFERDILLRGTLTLAAQIRNRVEQNGINSEGVGFKGYSTTPTLVGAKSFTKTAAWERAARQAKSKQKRFSGTRWVTVPIIWKGFVRLQALVLLDGGYKKIRELEGRQTEHKSFNRTGFMWRGFGVTGKEKNKFILGGRTKDSQNKINWNSERENSGIIYSTETEDQILADFVTQQLMQKFNDTFNS